MENCPVFTFYEEFSKSLVKLSFFTEITLKISDINFWASKNLFSIFFFKREFSSFDPTKMKKKIYFHHRSSPDIFHFFNFPFLFLKNFSRKIFMNFLFLYFFHVDKRTWIREKTEKQSIKKALYSLKSVSLKVLN